jgi:hypothetical protein
VNGQGHDSDTLHAVLGVACPPPPPPISVWHSLLLERRVEGVSGVCVCLWIPGRHLEASASSSSRIQDRGAELNTLSVRLDLRLVPGKSTCFAPWHNTSKHMRQRDLIHISRPGFGSFRQVVFVSVWGISSGAATTFPKTETSL